MSRRLVGRVHLEDPDSRQFVSFGPGDTVPEWAAALITNPAAWDTPEPQGDKPEDDAPAEPRGDKPERPAGNASRADWAAYAAALGVEVSADMSRDDIITAVDNE